MLSKITVNRHSHGGGNLSFHVPSFSPRLSNSQICFLFPDLDINSHSRQKAGLTQKEVAKIVGIRQSMISEYEHGKRRLTKEMGKKISTALKIKATHLQ
ncbi:helix-turn-helix transcriptional regulator [bacterium]|nr:helix-turn-helix transcriptional regulator [bacterium]